MAIRTQTIATHSLTPLLFLGLVAVVYAVALILAGRLAQMNGSQALAAGMAVDLVVIVPLAFYFLVVRRRGWHAVRVAPVVILSLVLAAQILPADHQQTLRILEYLVAPLEIGVLGWIIWRTATTLRKADRDHSADPLNQLRKVALELVNHERLAGLFASEIGVFYYVFGSWRSRPHAPAGWSTFSCHQRSGQAGLVFGLLFLTLAEVLAVHFLLARWSLLAAWIFTSISAYGALWLVADFRATVLRPTLVGPRNIVLRAGLRWTVDLPRVQIESMGRTEPQAGQQKINLGLMGGASHWLILKEPILAHGPYGISKQVLAIGLSPDNVRQWEELQP